MFAELDWYVARVFICLWVLFEVNLKMLCVY